MFERKRHAILVILTATLTVGSALAIARGGMKIYEVKYAQFEREQETFLHRAFVAGMQKTFQVCLEAAEQVSPRSRWYSEARQLGNYCRDALVEVWIDRARELAKQGRYQSAIYTIHQVPESHPQYKLAQKELEYWSKRMLTLAEEAQQRATEFPRQAIAIAAAIPEFSPCYDKARTKIRQWSHAWSANLQLERETLALQSANRLTEAQKTVAAIASINLHWQTRKQELTDEIGRQQAENEQKRQTFWQILHQFITVLLAGSGLFSFAFFVSRSSGR